MILSAGEIKYFKSISSKVSGGMASYQSATPYFMEDDPVITRYEALRKVWLGSAAVKQVCLEYDLSRSSYYGIENSFVRYGFAGLFPCPCGTVSQAPNLEQLVLIVKKCRPNVSQIAILRVAQAVPVTRTATDFQMISAILNSHGYEYFRPSNRSRFFRKDTAKHP